MTPTQRESLHTLYRALLEHYPRASVGAILDGVRQHLNGHSKGRLPDNAAAQVCVCGKEYAPFQVNQRYCSDECRLRTWYAKKNAKRREQRNGSKPTTTHRGA